jgi:hypothetical protein
MPEHGTRRGERRQDGRNAHTGSITTSAPRVTLVARKGRKNSGLGMNGLSAGAEPVGVLHGTTSPDAAREMLSGLPSNGFTAPVFPLYRLA